ncbi:DUF6703 family protein [Serinicoccus kebangsaanensis]|uniref:DUF6703 family protein n=1 Tax=Serinicoccus kebangsaanensis TaxID=2602069 RepID=UPI00124C973E|nr:DUF6703 family protein [Serinicoccus kebangsaanensis]
MSSSEQPSQPAGERPEGEAGTGRGEGIPEQAMPGRLRLTIEQASRPMLERLARLPVWLPFLALLLLILGGGLVGGPVGWVMVGIALLFVGWLLYLSWPRLTGVERVMRLAVLLLFLALTIIQLVPR